MATSNQDDNYFSNRIEQNDRTDWVPLSLTLVEYPKGKKRHETVVSVNFLLQNVDST